MSVLRRVASGLAFCSFLFSASLSFPSYAWQYAQPHVVMSSHGYHYGGGGYHSSGYNSDGYHGGGYHGGVAHNYNYYANHRFYNPNHYGYHQAYNHGYGYGYARQNYYRQQNVYAFQNAPRYNYVGGQGYYAQAPVYYVAPQAYAAPSYAEPVYNQPYYGQDYSQAYAPQQPSQPLVNFAPSVTISSGIQAQVGAQYVNANDNSCRMNAPTGDVHVIYGGPTSCDYVPPHVVEVAPQQPDYVPNYPVIRERY